MVPPGSRRRLVVCALVCALLAGAVAPGLAGAAGAGDRGTDANPGPGTTGALAQQETPANGTVRHEDPEAVDRQGDLGDVERYLAGRLAERLGEGAASVSRGQYEAARSALGDEYESQLARYVDVAGATEGEADDAAAESFRTAGRNVRTFANASAEFNETYRDYERAQERGDTERARTLARRLVEQSEDVNRTGGRLRADLQSIENATGRDTSTGRARVGNVSRNVTERAGAVAEATFARTAIEATATPTTVSFLQPTTVRGRLVDENGTALAGRTVLVGNASEAVRAETDEDGRFAATYRPARLPVEPGAVPVRYVPSNASVYLGSHATVPVTVEPVTPTVTAAVAPEAAAFGDPVTVSGRVAAEGAPAAGVPVLVTVDGVRLARVDATGEGTFEVSRPLPADVPAGDAQVTARVDQTGRALATASTAAPLSVEPTATALSVDGTLGGNETVVVSGRLRTADGTGVENRSVALQVAGATVERVETGSGGRFSARIPPAAYEVGEDGSVTVAARFDGAGTNLEGSTAAVTLAAPWVEQGSAVGGMAWWQWLAVAAAVGLAAAGGVVAWRRTRGGTDADGEAGVARTAAGGGDPEPGETESGAADGAWRADAAALLEGDETDRAVARAYGAARTRLAAELDVSGALTHWELYAAASEDGLGAERVEALLSLTEAYERARFAPSSVSAADAAAAVESAETVRVG